MDKEKREFKSFDDFTNLYEVQKTLRFELKPDPKTREWMNKHFEYDKDIQTFFKDQKIEDAYQTLKPIFDKIHEDFINKSLENDVVLEIDFSEYFNKYQNRKEIKEEELSNIEKSLRSKFEEIYKKQAEEFKEKAGKDTKGKDILKEKGYSILTEKGILNYIEKNIEKFKNIKSEEGIKKALNNVKRFFTYFRGFNQNRENYYETKKEASTAIATRIVHENLPKFCDNIIAFEVQKEGYLNTYDFLMEEGNLLKDKEGNALYPIVDEVFKISYFNKCLSQDQIEEYNKVIGNANYLINLYNQANKKKDGFKKLSLFKMLYKQIGCGKRDVLFFSLNYDRKNDYERINEKDIQSVEEVLEIATKAGKNYFCRENKESNLGIIKNINDFIEYVKNKENYLGVYWSKMALNTISNKYFANWHTLKDRLKEAKVFIKDKKGDEEDIRIPEAIELEGFFNVLDESIKNIEDKENKITWKSEGLFFKESLTEMLKNSEENNKNQKRKNLIEQSEKPSQALLALIFDDIQDFTDKFINTLNEIPRIKNYSEKESKEKIKNWMDNAVAINRIVKYFLVKESKTKGEQIDPIISMGLNTLLRSDDAQWFKWYDALRNYLTKKPQDDAKENKLKLNFECPYLLNVWSPKYGTFDSVILDKDRKRYLAIINRTGLTEAQVYKLETGISDENYSRRHIIITQKIDNKNPPRWFIRSNGENFAPLVRERKLKLSDEVLNIYDNELFSKTKNKNNCRPHLKKLIDYFKEGFRKHQDFIDFKFSWRDSAEYDSIADFYNHIASMCYKTCWKETNFNELLSLVNEGKIYLFEIRNQDLNDGKKEGHKDNLHTIYWNAIFHDTINKPKLNGEAEIFYRKPLTENELQKIKHKDKEIIQNYRFSKEKFLFHVPITLNFCLKNGKINDIINENISRNPNTCFFWDRSRRKTFGVLFFDKPRRQNNKTRHAQYPICE